MLSLLCTYLFPHPSWSRFHILVWDHILIFFFCWNSTVPSIDTWYKTESCISTLCISARNLAEQCDTVHTVSCLMVFEKPAFPVTLGRHTFWETKTKPQKVDLCLEHDVSSQFRSFTIYYSESTHGRHPFSFLITFNFFAFPTIRLGIKPCYSIDFFPMIHCCMHRLCWPIAGMPCALSSRNMLIRPKSKYVLLDSWCWAILTCTRLEPDSHGSCRLACLVVDI